MCYNNKEDKTMTKQMLKFPSIEQFRNAVKDVTLRAEYTGRDEFDEPIYDESLPKPVISFNGTVKLHGTNAAVCYSVASGMYFQSRENIITPENDNAGFARWADSKKDIFASIFTDVLAENGIGDIYSPELLGSTYSIFGEWAGQGIQATVGVSKLQKAFYVFGAKVTTPSGDPEVPATEEWLTFNTARSIEDQIYNINDYEKYSMTVDFNDPEASVERLTELTIAVETECPVSKALLSVEVNDLVVSLVDGKLQSNRDIPLHIKDTVVKILKELGKNTENPSITLSVG